MSERSDCYEIGLNRFLNIQKKSTVTLLILGLALILGGIVSSIIKYNSIDLKSVLFSCFAFILFSVFLIISEPNKLIVTPETIKLEYHGILINLFMIGRIRAGAEYNSSITLYSIKSIEYLQTPFEKLFSCGHIRVCADASAKKSNTIIKRQTFVTVYGLTAFEKTSGWMKNFFILS